MLSSYVYCVLGVESNTMHVLSPLVTSVCNVKHWLSKEFVSSFVGTSLSTLSSVFDCPACLWSCWCDFLSVYLISINWLCLWYLPCSSLYWCSQLLVTNHWGLDVFIVHCKRPLCWMYLLFDWLLVHILCSAVLLWRMLD